MGTIRPPTSSSSTSGASRKRTRTSSSTASAAICIRLLFQAALLAITFYVGVLVGLHSSGGMVGESGCNENASRSGVRGDAGSSGGGATEEQIESIVTKRVEVELARRSKQLPNRGGEGGTTKTNNESAPRTSKGMSSFAAGFARVNKDELITTYDYGVASQHSDNNLAEEAIILYTANAMPSDVKAKAAIQDSVGDQAPLIDVTSATANCDVLNVITLNPKKDAVCTVILNDYESFHLQRWMRQPETLHRSRSSTLDRKVPLRHVGRGVQSNGMDSFPAPKLVHQKDNMETLKRYFNSLEEVKAELGPIAKKVAVKNTVIVLVCNKGQSDLMLNFACSAKAKGLDLSNVLVFATDQRTHDLATGVGLTSFHDERNFGSIPEREAGAYGDRVFTQMMFAKVVPVQLLNMMGYDVLFQDVDVVWWKNPLEVFHDKNSKLNDFDILFQDDGARTVRFAPYSGNTGFYYVRHNRRTQYLFTQLLYNGDLIKETNSHQQALTALLNEHSSLTGLKVKTLDSENFPSGFHYHRAKPLMKKIVEKKHTPYLFHMCWTKNKDNKILFMEQMGMWYMNKQCTGSKAIDELDIGQVSTCCSAEPRVECHYRDKPSVVPCKDSPPIDEGRRSFW